MEVLLLLEKRTRELCGERFVTISKIIRFINCLKNKIKKTSRAHKDINCFFFLVNYLQNSISIRFGQTENNSIMTADDPETQVQEVTL